MPAYLKLITLVFLATALSGCIGIYNNSKVFRSKPYVGMTEMEVLEEYGNPDFSGFVEDNKVYIYEVRDNKYIILIGIYEGYDLVVTTNDGEVVNVAEAPRPEAFSLLGPVPWAEAN